MRYTWDVKDEGMDVYEDGVRVARLDPNSFVHILADISAHIRWRQMENNKQKFIESKKRHAEESIRK